MHILHVTTFLQGGAGRVIASLATAQREAGHTVTVVTAAGGEQGYESYPEYVEALALSGVQSHTVVSTFKRDVALNTGAAQQLRAALRGQHVDVAHTHAAIPSLVARMALGGRRFVPVVQTMHGWGVSKTADQAATDVSLLNLVDAIVTPSREARRMLQQHGVSAAPIAVVPNGIASLPDPRAIDSHDAALFDRLRAHGSRIALCIGTVGARKSQHLLLDALALGTLSTTHAVFIGDGETAALAEHAERLDVDSRAHVLGYRKHASRYLQHADVVVLPSQNEGLPIVVLEALRDGIPIVASALPEIAEAVDHGLTGYLFETGSAPALAAALARVFEATEPERRAMRWRMREVFDARYTLAGMTAAYLQIYNLSLNPASPGSRLEACTVGERQATPHAMTVRRRDDPVTSCATS